MERREAWKGASSARPMKPAPHRPYGQAPVMQSFQAIVKHVHVCIPCMRVVYTMTCRHALWLEMIVQHVCMRAYAMQTRACNSPA